MIEEDHMTTIPKNTLDIFEMIKNATTSMSSLIEDLLDYSKNVQNKETKENVNLEAVVENVLKLINPPANVQIKQKNLNHYVLFQPMAINQIISNLVSNAIKYCEKDIAEIEIIFDAEKCTLAVRDNGPGIEEKFHKKAFEIFKTLGNTSTGESSTGIGLSLVKKLVDRNDVTIEINNIPNSGSEFLISNFICSAS
jgi:signal transduction histidine kinase